jgi:tripartite-type tricarboxylate transporter receptor subunit TctC
MMTQTASAKLMTRIDLAHVSYRGAGPAVTDLISGQIAVTFTSTVISSTPDEFARTLRDECAKWARVVREARITVE